jgi:hypothetical protein
LSGTVNENCGFVATIGKGILAGVIGITSSLETCSRLAASGIQGPKKENWSLRLSSSKTLFVQTKLVFYSYVMQHAAALSLYGMPSLEIFSDFVRCCVKRNRGDLKSTFMMLCIMTPRITLNMPNQKKKILHCYSKERDSSLLSTSHDALKPYDLNCLAVRY